MHKTVEKNYKLYPILPLFHYLQIIKSVHDNPFLPTRISKDIYIFLIIFILLAANILLVIFIFCYPFVSLFFYPQTILYWLKFIFYNMILLPKIYSSSKNYIIFLYHPNSRECLGSLGSLNFKTLSPMNNSFDITKKKELFSW